MTGPADGTCITSRGNMSDEIAKLKLDNEFLKEARQWKREVSGWIIVSVLTLAALGVLFFGNKIGLEPDARAWARTILTAIGAGALAFIGGKGSKSDRPGA